MLIKQTDIGLLILLGLNTLGREGSTKSAIEGRSNPFGFQGVIIFETNNLSSAFIQMLLCDLYTNQHALNF